MIKWARTYEDQQPTQCVEIQAHTQFYSILHKFLKQRT